MKEKRFLSLILFITAFSLSAQVKGVVKDSITGEPIPFVNIWVENENIGTTSETNGSFSLDIKDDKKLIFSTLGYETKTIKSSKINTVYLFQKDIQLAEIVVENSKNTKEIEIGDVKKTFYLPEPQNVPWLFARKFNSKEKNKDVINVKELIYFTYSEVENGIFRARVYEVNKDGLPGKDLISDEIIVKVKKGKHKTVVDISKYNLQIPVEGIIVCFESLIVEQNKYLQQVQSIKPKKKYDVLNYAPHIMYFYNDLIENYNKRSGKWLHFNKTYKEKNKGVYKAPVPAINLTLTD